MRIITMILICCFAVSCQNKCWTPSEKELIENNSPTFRVLTIGNAADSMILRQHALPLSKNEIKSDLYKQLARKMIATVTSPEQDGVGIAGPQVGISRRIVAVQRFDKKDTPFEVYPNIVITAKRGNMERGPEGCLSVPNYRSDVMRYRNIDITYLSPITLKDTTENIKGFTAVIFQHETDHLDGIIYTDKLVE